MSKVSLIKAADRFRKLGPPSTRAWAQFRHLQKASGKAFAAAVPRKVTIIRFGRCMRLAKGRAARRADSCKLFQLLSFRAIFASILRGASRVENTEVWLVQPGITTRLPAIIPSYPTRATA